mmetsp:Transcript_99486/g.195420  ORF Transcript_99486/g.195420 Transcript_99486/m.195420 type:complete len:374 (+) Transcript_99486:83-1204(+)
MRSCQLSAMRTCNFLAVLASIAHQAECVRKAEITLPWQHHAPLPEWAGGMHNDFGREIGHGEHGTVYSCKLADGGDVALKVLDLEDPVNRQRFDHERHFMESFKSDYIVGYRGALDGMTPTGRRGVIFMEKSDGNLREVIEWRNLKVSPSNVTHPVLLGLSVDILRGLGELAETWCVHRDIAPSNILIFGDCESGNCRAKLADFGGAGRLQRTMFEGFHPQGVPSEHQYVAPELLCERVVTQWSWLQTDVWAAGVVLAELLGGSLPPQWAQSATAEGWQHHSSDLHRRLRQHIVSKVADEDLQRLILRMVHPIALRRIGMTEARREMERIATRHGMSLPPRQRRGNRRWGIAHLIPTPERLAQALPMHWSGLN